MYFDCCGIDPYMRRYLSDGYWVCQRQHKAGGHVDPADPAALAQLGLPLTGQR